MIHNLTNTNFFPHKQHKTWFLKQQFLCYNIVRDFSLKLKCNAKEVDECQHQNLLW
nr:MAG TPA: hypothetical protein [Caudoviricetes sp.]